MDKLDAMDSGSPAAEVQTKPGRTWPVVIKLQFPFDVGKTHIEEITIRRGRIGDIKGIPLADISTDHIVLVAARMSGQTTAVIERLDAEDGGEVMGIARNFLQRCLSTGVEPSPS